MNDLVLWAEILWTLLAIAGLMVSALASYDAYGDLLYLSEHRLNGARRIVASSNLRAEIARFVVHLLFLVIGLVVIFGPLAGYRQYVGRVILVGFILVAIVFVSETILVRRDRRKLLNLIMAEEEKNE